MSRAQVIHFSGKRHSDGEVSVYRNGGPLLPLRSFQVRNHSPDGFQWGYGGSGPAQLALALLLECCPAKIAEKWYQAFKWAFVANWPDEWSITSDDIRAWLRKAKMLAKDRGERMF